MGSTISYENNASIPLFLALGLQILLILLNRGYLQLIIGVCIALEGMILPVYVSIAYDVLASIGDAYYEASTVDGANYFQKLFNITLIFIFINAWNEYTVALCLISTDTFKPLTVGINIFNGYNIIEWQYLFAASIFAIIPVVIMFMSIEKNLTEGLTAGGVKG